MPITSESESTRFTPLNMPLFNSANLSSETTDIPHRVISGNEWDNRLVGSSKDELIQGGAGDDILIGNGGTDRLSGGEGNDRFQFQAGQSNLSQLTTITDFIGGHYLDSVEIANLAGYQFVQLYDAYATLEQGLGAVRAMAANQVVVFTVSAASTDSYVFIAAQGDREETLIRLEGADGRYLSRHDGSIRTLLEGTAGHDAITHGGTLDSYMDGGAGDDQLIGGGWYDVFIAGEGNDFFDGREWYDLLDASAAAVIVNDSGRTLTINGESIETGVLTGLGALGNAKIGRDRFTNIERFQAGDKADFIALGDTLSYIHAGGGDDLLLDKPNAWSYVIGGAGADRFVFMEGHDLHTGHYDTLHDFDAREDQLVFVTRGNYRVVEQIYQFGGDLTELQVQEILRSDETLANSIVFYQHIETSALMVIGDGGVSGNSLHNTVIVLSQGLPDPAELASAIRFVAEVPTQISYSDIPEEPGEVQTTVDEPDSGSIEHHFLLSINSAATESIRLWYETAGGSATAGVDYEAVSGWVTIEAGQTSAAIAVQILGDLDAEPDETVQLEISDPSGNWLPNGVTLMAEHTIRDNDLLVI